MSCVYTPRGTSIYRMNIFSSPCLCLLIKLTSSTYPKSISKSSMTWWSRKFYFEWNWSRTNQHVYFVIITNFFLSIDNDVDHVVGSKRKYRFFYLLVQLWENDQFLYNHSDKIFLIHCWSLSLLSFILSSDDEYVDLFYIIKTNETPI